MSSRKIIRGFVACCLFLTFATPALSVAPTASAAAKPPTASSVTSTVTTIVASPTASKTAPALSGISPGTPPDVLLNVPDLSVGRIELTVDNLKADINLNANVASLVSINAGVALSVQKINLTIVDVHAELELVVRLGHLVEIVNRVFQSLDLNPLLISAVNNLTSLLQPIVGAVDGLLGTVTQGGTTLSLLVDNLGNIVQQVMGTNGSPVSSIVGNYLTNMTDTGAVQTFQNGLTQKTYSYSPLKALVNIVFNAAGQVVQATVVKQSGGSTPISSTGAAQPTTTK